MIGVIVRRGCDVCKGERYRINDKLCHSDVGFVGLAVLSCEGIGEVGIEQHVNALPLQKKTTLSQPPQTKSFILSIGSANVRKQDVVGLEGTNHGSPSSLRTIDTPLTMFASFSLAAQRAVWLSPQSGANESFSAGAYFRQRRTRSATSWGVSM